jgi:NAD(P)-dependent dehydrogenase (short-subunit alcohol dehydrogenase family)
MANPFEPGAFAGKTVFVAGGTSGINLGMARRFARAGANLSVISRKTENVESAVVAIRSEGSAAMGAAADVRDYAAVDAAIAATQKAFGPIDVVISGAAGNFIAPAIGLSANAFKTVIDIDLLGTFNVFRASFEYLRRPGASLIAITAPQAVNPTMFQAHACAAKAGINMLTKCLAMEWGPAGVRVNGISPGAVSDTEGFNRLAPTEEIREAFRARLPLREIAVVDDISNAALFLSSESGRYITGTILDCDGGAVLGDASPNALVAPKR